MRIVPPAIVDNFNRANETPLTKGGLWLACNGTSDHNLVSQELKGANWNCGTAYNNAFSASQHYGIGWRMTNLQPWFDSGQQEHNWCYLRTSHAPDEFYQACYYRIHLRHNVSGNWIVYFCRYSQLTDTEVEIATVLIGVTPVLGDEIFFSSSPQGILRCALNNVVIASAEDLTSGYYDNGGYAVIRTEWDSGASYQEAADDVRCGLVSIASESILPYRRIIVPNGLSSNELAL